MLRRLAEALEREGVPADARILVALSGGADSVCLLLALHELARPVAAAHVHHGIRGAEADRDAAFCAALCERLCVPFRLLRTDIPALARERRRGLEETARAERYRLLEAAREELSCDRIATAHNLEDNAETLLLHLVRGGGLAGLCGIRPAGERLIRPLLSVSREEILAFLAERGEAYMTDSTNACTDLSRNRLRRNVLPELRALNPEFARAFARTARTVSEDEAFLRSLAKGPAERLSAAELSSLPRPVAKRALRMAYTAFCGEILSEKATEAALALCKNPSPSARLCLPGAVLRREYDALRFVKEAEQPPPTERPLQTDGVTEWPGYGQITASFGKMPENVYNSLNSFYISRDRIEGDIIVRPRRPGDTFQNSPRGARRKLKKRLTDDKIDRFLRDCLPVIADGEKLLAVGGYGVDAAVAARPGEESLHIVLAIKGKE